MFTGICGASIGICGGTMAIFTGICGGMGMFGGRGTALYPRPPSWIVPMVVTVVVLPLYAM